MTVVRTGAVGSRGVVRDHAPAFAIDLGVLVAATAVLAGGGWLAGHDNDGWWSAAGTLVWLCGTAGILVAAVPLHQSFDRTDPPEAAGIVAMGLAVAVIIAGTGLVASLGSWYLMGHGTPVRATVVARRCAPGGRDCADQLAEVATERDLGRFTCDGIDPGDPVTVYVDRSGWLAPAVDGCRDADPGIRFDAWLIGLAAAGVLVVRAGGSAWEIRERRRWVRRR